MITGGGAYLRGIDKRIVSRTGITSRIADDADMGTGESLKYIDIISRNSLNRRETYI